MQISKVVIWSESVVALSSSGGKIFDWFIDSNIRSGIVEMFIVVKPLEEIKHPSDDIDDPYPFVEIDSNVESDGDGERL